MAEWESIVPRGSLTELKMKYMKMKYMNPFFTSKTHLFLKVCFFRLWKDEHTDWLSNVVCGPNSIWIQIWIWGSLLQKYRFPGPKPICWIRLSGDRSQESAFGNFGRDSPSLTYKVCKLLALKAIFQKLFSIYLYQNEDDLILRNSGPVRMNECRSKTTYYLPTVFLWLGY